MQLWQSAFLLCMSHIHHVLTTKHRLRHFARIQYIVFLKVRAHVAIALVL